MLNTTVHGDGYPLVWGHGLMGSVELESANGWFHSEGSSAIRRIRYDARGHGQSPGGNSATEHRWKQLGLDMLDIAHRHAGTARFALGGQSMGCASALFAALQAPQQVSHLVLALPPTAWASRPAQAERYGKMLALIRARGVAALVNLARQFPTAPGWLLAERPEDNEEALRVMSQFELHSLERILRGAMASDLPPRSALAELTMPALILAWEDDNIHPLETAHALAETLPNAELEIISAVSQLKQWPTRIDTFVSRQTGAA